MDTKTTAAPTASRNARISFHAGTSAVAPDHFGALQRLWRTHSSSMICIGCGSYSLSCLG
jgi:hypothetical protein